MNSSKSAAFCLALAAMVPTATLADAPTAQTAWRQAYGSSPGSPEGMTGDMFKRLMEHLKLPENVVAMMKPSEVTGTLRYRVRLAAAGSQVQIRFSNEEGTKGLRIAGASVALAGNGFDASPSSLKRLTFGGKPSIMIPAGGPIVSDPIDLPVAHGTDLLITIDTPDEIQLQPAMGGPLVVAPAGQVEAATLRSAVPLSGRPLVTGISVRTAAATRVIVAMGDSITDGVREGTNGLHSWPEQLDRRLAAGKQGSAYSVVNAGIGGNRLLASAWGASALARLDRDALRLEGLSHLILLEGTNDLGMSGNSLFGQNPPVTLDDLLAGYRQVLLRAHQKGVKVIFGTITPRVGSIDFTPEKEKIRMGVNQWIRTSGENDGYIDFDKMLRDPKAPNTLLALYDSGDHLHPSDAGYKAMGDGIDLGLFK